MLDLTNVINVSVAQAPIGLGAYNVNNVALFTTETPSPAFPSAGYSIYVSAQAVGADFGTSSVTFAMAAAFFSQSPNVLNGGGRLIIAPMAGSSLAIADITGLQAKVFFVGVIATAYPASTGWATLAGLVQALGTVVLVIPSSTYADVAGAFTSIKQAVCSRVRCIYYDGESALTSVVAAYVGAGFSVNYNMSNSTLTMNLKQLIGILPDEGLTQTQRDAAMAAGADTYCNIAGIPAVQSSGANDFFDNVVNLVWFVCALKVAGFNALAQVASKVPQTEQGVSLLKSAYRTVCQQAVVNAYIAPGSWTGSDTFGVQADFQANVNGFGFYIYSQPVSQQLKAEREARRAPTIQIAVKLAGAIHSSNVIVNLNA